MKKIIIISILALLLSSCTNFTNSTSLKEGDNSPIIGSDTSVETEVELNSGSELESSVEAKNTKTEAELERERLAQEELERKQEAEQEAMIAESSASLETEADLWAKEQERLMQENIKNTQ